MAQEAEFRLHTGLKMKALGRLEGLHVLSFEKTLHVKAFNTLQRHGVPEQLVGTWNVCRAVLSKELLGKPKTAETLRAALTRRHDALTDIDASWEVGASCSIPS